MARRPARRRYSIRDLLGHFVKPRSERGKMCPHACCRGKRVHPANFPVILPKKLLREASDRELMDHYGKHAGNGNARRQLEAEMNRRDRVDARRRGASDRAAVRASDRAVAYQARWEAAERATRGNMVNARGRHAGVSERRVLTNRADAERYGTDELRAFLDSEGRKARRVTAGGAEKRRTRPAPATRTTSSDPASFLNPEHRLNRRLAARRAR